MSIHEMLSRRQKKGLQRRAALQPLEKTNRAVEGLGDSSRSFSAFTGAWVVCRIQRTLLKMALLCGRRRPHHSKVIVAART
jgi:hypothetical protein